MRGKRKYRNFFQNVQFLNRYHVVMKMESFVNIRFHLKMLLVDSTFLRGTSIVFLLHLLLLQVGLDVHPHPPFLLFGGGVLVCVPVVVREILKLKNVSI